MFEWKIGNHYLPGKYLAEEKKQNYYQNEDTETNILLSSWRQSTGGSCIVRNRHTVTFRL